MTGFPFLFYGLTGIYVAALLSIKTASPEAKGKLLSVGAALTSAIVGVIALFVFFAQGFDLPGPGVIMITSTLLSVVFWTASLIWAGPATREDRLVFTGTIILTFLMFISAPILG